MQILGLSACEMTTALRRSPQNNAFGAIAVQFWCILSYIVGYLNGAKTWALEGAATPRPPLNMPMIGVSALSFLGWFDAVDMVTIFSGSVLEQMDEEDWQDWLAQVHLKNGG